MALALLADAPSASEALAAVRTAGRMLVITGEVPLWWAAVAGDPGVVPDFDPAAFP